MSVFSAIPAEQWLASNEHAFAIADGFPVSPGHTLVIARREVPDWWQATPIERAAVMNLVDVVKSLLDESHAPDGYNVGFNAGGAAGQTVDHLHVHLIPRYKGDVPDPRGGIRHAIPALGNYLAAVEVTESPLITATDAHMYRTLRRCFESPMHDRIDLLVSFVMQSGVRLLAESIDEALGRGARIRLLATDYLSISDPAALGFFFDRMAQSLATGRLEARVFSDPTTSFHPKAYLFSSTEGDRGTALVGSSNMSASALRTGVEWNLRSTDLPPLLREFERLWSDDRSRDLTQDWLEAYKIRSAQAEARRANREDVLVEIEPEEPIAPWSVQKEALAALEATRVEGHRAALVVMATGLGKTWLAAFDSTRPSVRRVLFVAHREEILQTSRDVYRRIRPEGRLTMFTGGERDPYGDVVFASVQSLSRNLSTFSPDAFDYIVVDEFHHAAAPTYRQVIAHFEPAFLLGLTATPDRTDAADLLALCGDNLVYECDLLKGLDRGLLSPFRYRAIRDVADYAEIPWRSGRFDAEALSEQLETRQRAQQILDEWHASGGPARRSLGFCCSITHADFMARFFTDNGVRSVAVHSGESSAQRSDALDRLEVGELEVVFSVDLFNEGIDVPAVDLVMMLRPTESPIIFLQQLGRGLRRHDQKRNLAVLDLVGNHRGFLLKARLLASLAGRPHLTDREAVDLLREPLNDLPEGCSIVVETEAVDLLSRLLGAPKSQDRLAELARAWTADHEGARPRALELSMVSGATHSVKSLGGWFGFLGQLGMLNETESEVARLAGPLFLEMEHGAYSKSWKLVTLQAILDMGTLTTGSPIPDVALASRWRVMRDPRLMADLTDASAQFDDPERPTDVEWERYWRKNPINAWIGGNRRGAEPWFRVDGDDLCLDLEIPERLAPVLGEMVAEIVEYRLHRYLLGQEVKRHGRRLKPLAADGTEIDAAFVVESLVGRPTSILFESAGGAGDGGTKRNPGYVDGVDIVLERLKEAGATILDAYVDSGRVRSLPVPDRRLDPGAWHFPIALADVGDLTELRRLLLRSMARVGRAADAKGVGNSRKAMRLVIETPGQAGVDTIAWVRSGSSRPPGKGRVPDAL